MLSKLHGVKLIRAHSNIPNGRANACAMMALGCEKHSNIRNEGRASTSRGDELLLTSRMRRVGNPSVNNNNTRMGGGSSPLRFVPGIPPPRKLPCEQNHHAPKTVHKSAYCRRSWYCHEGVGATTTTKKQGWFLQKNLLVFILYLIFKKFDYYYFSPLFGVFLGCGKCDGKGRYLFIYLF